MYNVQSRMSVFTPRVTRYIDVSTWDDPPRDWNETINVNVTQPVDINGVNGNGRACICQVYNLDFGQWLSANAAAQSSIAIDTFQLSTDYLSPDADTQMLEQVYEGEPLFSSSYGFVQPAILTPTEPSLVTNNKFLRVEGASPSEGILLRASSEGDYGVEIYRVEESSSVDWVRNRRTRRLYSTQTDGSEIHLDPVPEGYFYTIVIKNPGETGYDFDSRQPPYHCVYNEYGLKTKFDVTFTTSSTSSTYNASTKTNVGISIVLAAASIAASMLVSF